MSARIWDIFCRVVDNFGDIGVCWRLAADLASRGETVRLWADDRSALAWLAPAGARGVSVVEWADPAPVLWPGDVVIEAFGCDPPAAFVRRMAAREVAPVWINLEYLNAEPQAERLHRLPSPQPNGLTKWFFYPGFSAASGGLIREPGLMARREGFQADPWLAALGAPRRAGERVVTLFCYDQPALAALLAELQDQPTLLLATAGHAARQVADLLGLTLQRGMLRAQVLPLLAQPEFDHLLWAADLNFVRGEDSFVRAQWAGHPFVWQIYPQADGAQARKLAAFLERHLAGAESALAHEVRRGWQAWNGGASAGTILPALPLPTWRQHCTSWRDSLFGHADLSTQLLRFVAGTR